MKRIGIIVAMGLMFFGLCGKASAQFLSGVPDLKGKMIYGGNFGFGISGNYLNLSLAPLVGYRVVNPWEIGVRGIYNLQCYFDRYHGDRYSHYFGVAPYTNFQVHRGLFLHVEDEVMYGFSSWNHQTTEGKWFNTVFVGGGYRRYSPSGSFVYFMVLYNFTWGLIPSGMWDTPYLSPFELRVGFCF